MNETVSQVMTADPITVTADTSYKRIDEILADAGISAVPVVDEHGAPIGVVSEEDLMPRLRRTPGGKRPGPFAGARSRRESAKAHGLIAKDLMTTPVRAISPTDSVAIAAVRLAETGVRRLFVIDGAKLLGVVSRRDLLKTFRRSDTLIQADIERKVLRNGLSVLPDQAKAAVEDGIVTLVGRLDSKGATRRAEQLTTVIPGVVEVRNRLDYVWNDQDDRHFRPTTVGI